MKQNKQDAEHSLISKWGFKYASVNYKRAASKHGKSTLSENSRCFACQHVALHS